MYVARNNNIKMIRIDHTWTKKSIDEWTTFIQEAIKSEKMIVTTNNELYSWINDNPSEETIKKLMV